MNGNNVTVATNPSTPVVGYCSKCRATYSVAISDSLTSNCPYCSDKSAFRVFCPHCAKTFFSYENALDTLAPCPNCGKELLLSALLCEDGTKNVVSTTGRLEMHHFGLALELAKCPNGGTGSKSTSDIVATASTIPQQDTTKSGFSIWLVIGSIQRVVSIMYLIGEATRTYYSVYGETPETQPCAVAFIVGIAITCGAYHITNPCHAKVTFYRYLLWMLVSGIPMRIIANFILCAITNDSEALVINMATHALIYGILIVITYLVRPKVNKTQ